MPDSPSRPRSRTPLAIKSNMSRVQARVDSDTRTGRSLPNVSFQTRTMPPLSLVPPNGITTLIKPLAGHNSASQRRSSHLRHLLRAPCAQVGAEPFQHRFSIGHEACQAAECGANYHTSAKSLRSQCPRSLVLAALEILLRSSRSAYVDHNRVKHKRFRTRRELSADTTYFHTALLFLARSYARGLTRALRSVPTTGSLGVFGRFNP